MSYDPVFKLMNTVHRVLLKISCGRLGWRVQRMPVLTLTTTGRRSGRPHSVLLTLPVGRVGTAFVVVASRGGDDQAPAWYLNLLDNPEVEVALEGAAAQRMRARVAHPDERARLWPLIVADHPNYATYQRRTEREIPVIFLEPLPG